jgi:hypothetical protein
MQQLLDYEHGPVMLIGRQGANLPKGDLTFAEGHGDEQLICRVLHSGRPPAAPKVAAEPESDLPAIMADPPNYLYEMYMRPANADFLQACADLLIELTDAPRPVGDQPDLRLLAFETKSGEIRLLVGNETYIYVLGRVDMGREIKEVRIASHYPGRPIYPDGRFVDVRVPPRGMIVLDMIPG